MPMVRGDGMKKYRKADKYGLDAGLSVRGESARIRCTATIKLCVERQRTAALDMSPRHGCGLSTWLAILTTI